MTIFKSNNFRMLNGPLILLALLVSFFPASLTARQSDGEKTQNDAAFEQPQEYRIKPGDALVVYMEELSTTPKEFIRELQSYHDGPLPPTQGYIVTVCDDGCVLLPQLFGRLKVEGMTLAETYALMRRAYIDIAKIMGTDAITDISLLPSKTASEQDETLTCKVYYVADFALPLLTLSDHSDFRHIEAAADYIRTTIAPETWNEEATIRLFSSFDVLLVNQTEAVHAEIVKRLIELRKLDGPQAIVEFIAAELSNEPPQEHRIKPGDVLVVYIETVTISPEEFARNSRSPDDDPLPPTQGYIVTVRDDGAIALPRLMGALKVEDMTLAEAHAFLRRAYVDVTKILGPGAVTDISRILPKTALKQDETLTYKVYYISDLVRSSGIQPTSDRKWSVPEDIEAIADYIRATVAPETWNEKATIRPFHTTDVLLVNQTEAVHAEIVKRLIELRKLDGPQAVVEFVAAALSTKQPDKYRLGPGDVLAIYVEAVTGKYQHDHDLIPVYPAAPNSGLPPSKGYVFTVGSDGAIKTPELLSRTKVEGLTVAEAQALVCRSYVDLAKILAPEATVTVSLLRARSAVPPDENRPDVPAIDLPKEGEYTARQMRIARFQVVEQTTGNVMPGVKVTVCAGDGQHAPYLENMTEGRTLGFDESAEKFSFVSDELGIVTFRYPEGKQTQRARIYDICVEPLERNGKQWQLGWDNHFMTFSNIITVSPAPVDFPTPPEGRLIIMRQGHLADHVDDAIGE